MTIGEEMFAFITKVFPICRSLTGNGVRETLAEIGRHLPDLIVYEVPSGTQAFDWTVPDEWNITAAQLTGPDGQIIVDFANHNLHVVGYSEPVDQVLSLDQLQKHLFSTPELPDAIPYVTSYYQCYWGFCLPHRVREKLPPGNYHAKINSVLAPGNLTYGEVILPGKSRQEIFLSTNICHPSMANNELSGPAVTTWLAKYLMQKNRRYTYRIVFVPETIGSIVYLSRNLDVMRQNIVAGYNISCVGDNRCYSYLPSRNGNTLSDRVAQYVLENISPDYKRYTYLDRGSDERQYCAPGVDLPFSCIMRSKYGCYPEYHTSADDLNLITTDGLEGSYRVLKRCLDILEENYYWRTTVICEPQLGKRGLYPNTSTRESVLQLNMINFLAYADGEQDLLAISQLIDVEALECSYIAHKLASHGLLEATRDL